MITQYGLRFCCDACGAEADGVVPPPGSVSFSDQPAPDGWCRVYDLGFELRNTYGIMLTHLCDRCSRLRLGQLFQQIMAYHDAQQAKAGK